MIFSSCHRSALAAAECTGNFITVIDALQLNLRAKDELVPHLRSVISSLNRVSGLPAEFEGKTKTTAWLSKFSTMQAFDEISEEEARELSYDLDKAHGDFIKFLKTQQ